MPAVAPLTVALQAATKFVLLFSPIEKVTPPIPSENNLAPEPKLKVGVALIGTGITKPPTPEAVELSIPPINNIEWHNGTTPISKADIEAKMVELQAEYDAKQYQRKRAAEYPSMADQLDNIYHNGIDAWKATIKTIKDKYPKE